MIFSHNNLSTTPSSQTSRSVHHFLTIPKNFLWTFSCSCAHPWFLTAQAASCWKLDIFQMCMLWSVFGHDHIVCYCCSGCPWCWTDDGAAQSVISQSKVRNGFNSVLQISYIKLKDQGWKKILKYEYRECVPVSKSYFQLYVSISSCKALEGHSR